MYTVDTLRSDIRKTELTVARIRPGIPANDVLDLLQLLDRISAGYQTLEDAGLDLRPERTRIETVHRLLAEKDRTAVRALAMRGGLARVRGQVKPSENHWWWYLDEFVAERRKRKLRHLSWGLAGGALVLVVLILAYVRFLRPDEATRLRYGYVFDAESQIQESDYAGALDNYKRAFELAPDDPEINLMLGVMYEAMQQSEDADMQYKKAQALYETQALFLTMRAQKYSLLGWHDKGERDAQSAIELDDSLPLAYCALGGAYEGQGENAKAIAAFQKCADLARAQKQDELYVIAAARLATLLQMP